MLKNSTWYGRKMRKVIKSCIEDGQSGGDRGGG